MSRLVPRGVVVAGLGRRFLAAVIDALPVVLLAAIALFTMRSTESPAISLVAVIVTAVALAAYSLYQWWAYATRGAGIGARVAGVQLVSLQDGQPVGWWRFFLRQLVFSALMGSVVGGIALLIFLVIHERRQGWHDMVAGAVLVEPRRSEARQPTRPRTPPTTSTVGLPPHLASSFSPQAGTTAAYSPTPAPAPDWLPGVQSEPIAPQAPWPSAQPPAQPPAPPWQGQQSQAPMPWQPPQAADPLAQGRAPAAPALWQAPAIQPDPLDGPQLAPESPSKPQQSWIPIPSASSVVEPSRPVRVRQREFGEVDDDEGTRIAQVPVRGTARAGEDGWYARLDDGREVELTVTVLLGRNPHKTPEDPAEVHLVPASGDGRMISRTHVLIGSDPRGVFVVDRGSTNGTAVVGTGGALEPCPPGTQVRVKEGQQVSYGNRWFTILRRPVS